MLNAKKGSKVLLYKDNRVQGLLTVTRVTKTLCAAEGLSGREYRFRLVDGYEYGAGNPYIVRRITACAEKIKEFEDWVVAKREELKNELTEKMQQASITKLQRAINELK